MMSLREALFQWQKQGEYFKHNCCLRSHHYVDELGRWLPKSDDQVCPREKAWREYVRARDENPDYPFNTIFKIH